MLLKNLVLILCASFLLALSVGCTSTVVDAQREARSNLDYRAAYCLAKENDDAEAMREALSLLVPGSDIYQGTSTELSVINAKTDRLKRYLDARSNAVGPNYLHKASEEAQADKPIAKKKFAACMATCHSGQLPRAGEEQAWAKCIADCQSGVPAVQRRDSCYGSDWIPR